MSYYRIQDSRYGTDGLLSGEHLSIPMNGDEAGVRHGVSCCDSIEALADYIAHSAIEIGTRPEIIEMDGPLAADQPLDDGEFLIQPTTIISRQDAEAAGFFDLVNNIFEAEGLD